MATISRTGITAGGTISQTHITNIIDALDGTSASTTVIASGSFSGSLTGLATTSTSASYAISSSFATTATTATNATNTLLVAVTDTTTGTGPYYITFVDGTSSNKVARVDSTTLTYNATTNLITATASYANQALSSSFATTASFASFATTASYVANASSFPYSGSARITGSLDVTGSLSISGSATIKGTTTTTNLTMSGSLSGVAIASNPLILNLSNIASGGKGTVVLPTFQPVDDKQIGSVYWFNDTATLYVWDGANWRSSVFT
jgi:hypothetical protein